jgi:hypothetical protein
VPASPAALLVVVWASCILDALNDLMGMYSFREYYTVSGIDNYDTSTVPDEAFDQGWIRLLLVPISLYALMFDHSGCINILQWEVELPMAGILVAFRGMHRRYDGLCHRLSFNVNRLGHQGFQLA